jgi:hypothetical protein
MKQENTILRKWPARHQIPRSDPEHRSEESRLLIASPFSSLVCHIEWQRAPGDFRTKRVAIVEDEKQQNKRRKL